MSASAKKTPKTPAAPLAGTNSPAAVPAQAQIIAEARSHFFAHGFRGVTMDDLAVELGMSKKTLYAHFPSKTALLEAVIREKMQRVQADFERILAESTNDVLATLHALLACLQTHTAEIQPAFFRDIRRETPELFAHVQSMRRENIHRTFGRVLADGRRAGVVRADIPIPVLLEILTTLADSIVNPQKLGELGLSVKDGVTAVLAVFLEGTLSNEGRTQKQKAFL